VTAIFGTDGIRAPFGEPPLDRRTVTALGFHLARRLGTGRPRPQLLLGGDTRDSTPQVAAWLAGGLGAGGATVRWAGVLPTPAVARLVPRVGAAAGVAISASHNPWPDNGIKLIAGDGGKWPRGDEAALEGELAQPAPEAAPTGGLVADPALATNYLDSLLELFARSAVLEGLHVTLDCANGAASGLGRRLFERAGAVVHTLGDRPDGRNINQGCGSTAPETLARATLASGSDLGIAFDGDADRAVLVDERGEVRDGDAVLYLWARTLAERGGLAPARIVATSMSNLGLERALAADGVGVVRCDVGDRAVVETLRREGLVLGGEQSGHIVHLGLGPTGDGLLTGLMVAAIRREAGRSLSELLRGFRRYPQVLLNVPVRSKPSLESLPAVQAAADAVRARLGEDGRLVLRYSGTEPLARVMIEGPEQPLIEALARDLAAALEQEIGA
jgi:phosphoglucosamine mutase